MPIRTSILVPLLTFALFSACSSGSSSGEGVATESICPPMSNLSYASFGRDFMSSYCTRCHSSSLSGSDRNEAPVGHDFDTLEGILEAAEHIDEYAAAGPAGINTAMPPSSPSPSEEERRKLGEWLACEIDQ